MQFLKAFILVLAASCACQPLLAQSTNSVEVPAAPVVDATQDKAAKDCQDYLEKMNGIIQEYDQTVTSTLIGPQGMALDDKSMKAAAQRTLKLTKQLKKIHAPDEINDAHKQLSASLPTLHDFFVLNHGNDRSFNKALELAGQIRNTLDVYHQGVMAMIANHNLDPSLDPVAAEQKAVTQRALQGAQEWATQAAGVLQKLMQQPGSVPQAMPQQPMNNLQMTQPMNTPPADDGSAN